MTALRELRATMGIATYELCRRLRITPGDLRTLESTPFRLLEVDALQRYVRACGCDLAITATDRIDGRAVVLLEEGAPR